jgi:hypothetical protein
MGAEELHKRTADAASGTGDRDHRQGGAP